MTSSQQPFSTRPFWQRWHQRFMDWLWFGPLTRDLHPAPYPSRLRVACTLLADICRSGWSLLLPDLERSRRPGR